MPRLATRCIACDNADLDRQSAVLMPFIARRALGWAPCEVTPAWGLRDLPTGWAHALCATLHCPQCGLVFLDMRFDDDEMGRLYQGYRGPEYEAQREALEPGYAARNRALLAGDAHIPLVEAFLRPWLPANPAVLDWGGDTGLNTPLRHEASVHHVLDISGRPLVAGCESVTEVTRAYDLVVLAHVLEHVPEPALLIGEIVATMGAATKLYIEVPFEALMRDAVTEPHAWQRKRHWHEHVNFYSEESLMRLLQRCGLVTMAATQIPIGGSRALAMVCSRV